ncbi:MAG TPA: VacJ family lipoprotein [Caulobacteraceae bacterium]|nr:VacJ family lipoprotein [Caulobacteraceae bacterium]
MRPRLLSVLAAAGVLCAAAPALAQPGEAAARGDPLQAFNRRMFALQSGLQGSLLVRVLAVYRALTPGVIGVAVHNVLTNVSEPVVIANDVLQLRLKQAGRDTLRLVADTTAGWLGLFDVATPGGLPHHDNDFGITLGRWGVGPGPYLYLPLLGPSTVRDAVGSGVDVALSPLTYLSYPDKAEVSVGQEVLSALDTYERAEPDLNALLAGAADPYATLRSVYLQNREAQIRGSTALPPLAPLDPADPPADTGPGPSASLDPAPAAQSPAAAAAERSAAAPALADAGEDAPIATARDYEPRLVLARAEPPPA